MRHEYEPGGPLEGFSEPVPFTSENLGGVPNKPGVHMVWGPDGEPLYAGMTGSQRDRLRMHLTGDRQASVLHKKVGERLDEDRGREATRDEIQAWLAQCDVAWKQSDDKERLKARIMEELHPVLNEVVPRVSHGDGEPSTWDVFIDWARVFYDDPEFGSIEREYKIELGQKVQKARTALQVGEPWLEPLREAFRSPLNNITRWNQHDAFLDWAASNPDDAVSALTAIWDRDRDLMSRIDGFMEHFPRVALSGSGLRATVASLLLMGDDPTQYPPYKPTTLTHGYRLIGYPSAPSGAKEAGRYEHALGFFDQIIEEAADRGLELRDRLDAQSVLWAILKNDLPSSSSDDQRARLALYRQDYRPAWWVNQGTTYRQERGGGYVWAPAKTRSGFTAAHHAAVLQLKKGDTVVHYAKGEIRAIGMVTKAGYRARRPSDLPTEAWQEDGFRANVKYFDLDNPIKLQEIPVEARQADNMVFDVNGGVKLGYLFGMSRDFSDELQTQFEDRWPPGSPWHHDKANHWLFQSNPSIHDLVATLEEKGVGGHDDWVVQHFRDEMRPGDRVVLWLSGSDAGAYAIGTLINSPKPRSRDESFSGEGSDWGVDFTIDQILDPPVLRRDIVHDPVLKDLGVIRQAQGTNYRLTEQEWNALMDLAYPGAGATIVIAVTADQLRTVPGLGRWSWSAWHESYNEIDRGDTVVFAHDEAGQIMYRIATVMGPGVSDQTEGETPSFALPIGAVTNEHVVDADTFEDAIGAGALVALALSKQEGGRGVLLHQHSPTGAPATLDAVVTEFSGALAASGLRFDPEFVRAFVVSLATKGFVLLTGLSGSGKTQIARSFGQWLGSDHYLVVPVRPDWTGPDALLGYEDGLSQTGAWKVPEALEFMLKAVRDPASPYLLLLDEMNLAHVERYFADVLSGIESGEPTLPNLARDGDSAEWKMVDHDVPRLPWPENLLIVGTVNIDETTYMFSPKVLDRANTLEFRVKTDDLSLDTIQISDLAPGDRSVIAGFAAAAESRPTAASWAGADEFGKKFKDLHEILATFDREFGHRVFAEAVRFGALLSEAGNDDDARALDLQVMQKVLPRFHGSVRQIGKPLAAVGSWAYDGTAREGFDIRSDDLDSEPVLPITFDKVKRMTTRLHENHFVSFAE